MIGFSCGQGLITTSDIGALVRVHEHTFSEPSFVGANMRVTDIDGAMLGVQLTKLMPMLERLRKRRAIFEAILETSDRFRVSPRHDRANAVGLTVIFETPDQAVEFSERPGVARVYDNSKHIYTNWEPIIAKRTFRPKLNSTPGPGPIARSSAAPNHARDRSTSSSERAASAWGSAFRCL